MQNKRIAGVYPGDLKSSSEKDKAANTRLAGKLKRHPPADLDDLIQTRHRELFREVDCLDCANCCKTTPALIDQRDIKRISKHLNMTAGNFISQYVEMDEDGDFVLNATPCVFLGDDNHCSIYEVRPSSCADYPHTLRRKQHKILDLTCQNTAVCPVVFQIFRSIRQRYDKDVR